MKKWLVWSLGIVIGALLGFVYWYYVGCLSGSCAITSSPVNSTIYGAVLGVLTASHFTSKRNESDKVGK
jgi:hypothetical protein